MKITDDIQKELKELNKKCKGYNGESASWWNW